MSNPLWELDIATRAYLFACRQYVAATPANEAERLEKWRDAWNTLKNLHEKAQNEVQHSPRHRPGPGERA